MNAAFRFATVCAALTGCGYTTAYAMRNADPTGVLCFGVCMVLVAFVAGFATTFKDN